MRLDAVTDDQTITMKFQASIILLINSIYCILLFLLLFIYFGHPPPTMG